MTSDRTFPGFIAGTGLGRARVDPLPRLERGKAVAALSAGPRPGNSALYIGFGQDEFGKFRARGIGAARRSRRADGRAVRYGRAGISGGAGDRLGQARLYLRWRFGAHGRFRKMDVQGTDIALTEARQGRARQHTDASACSPDDDALARALAERQCQPEICEVVACGGGGSRKAVSSQHSD